ncbi:MAG TPA: Cof-type HAD-IIB family hydrolase [Chloroflexota bacterium]|nr:Cof-type HAD-IIB family hydrolase [Chloroflexota bacterium]
MTSDHAPRIRLLACDMDGTLFRGDLKISQPVQTAIAAAQRAGVRVVLATGRMPAAAKAFVELLGLSGPQIYYNGALVSTPDGEVLFHLPVESPVAQSVVAYVRASAMHLNAYVGDTIYVERLGPEAEFTRQLNRVDPVLVDDLAAFLERAPTKLVVVRLPSVEEGLIPRLASQFDGNLSISSSVPQYCEMINPAVDKGRALRAMAERLGLAADEVAAIGDGDNDTALLEAAGLSFAMGNGTERLKALATRVVGTVEQDGVAEAIEQIIGPR